MSGENFWSVDSATWLQAAFAGLSLIGIPSAFAVLLKEMRHTYRIRCGPYLSTNGQSVLWNLKIVKGRFTQKRGAKFLIWGDLAGHCVQTCRILGDVDSGVSVDVQIDKFGCAIVDINRWLSRRPIEVRISFLKPDAPAIYADDLRVNYHYDIEYEENFHLQDIL